MILCVFCYRMVLVFCLSDAQVKLIESNLSVIGRKAGLNFIMAQYFPMGLSPIATYVL